jgi:peptidoglycan/LPS O-acetylase OafA/YrhL
MRYGRMAVLVLGKLLTADIKYDNIALMRSVAIVVVILFHLNLLTWPTYVPEWLNRFVVTGFLGVDLFFFISGFVIIYPASRNEDTSIVLSVYSYPFSDQS